MMTGIAHGMRRGWRAELAVRMRRHFAVKVLGVTAFTSLFFVGYFHVLRNPAYPVMQMPLTAFDHLIGFQPQALYVYLTLWIYVGLPPGLMLRWRDLIFYCLSINALLLAGLTCFYFWPTEVPLRTMDVTDFPGFAMLKGVDAAGNACPSMHVAAAIFSAFWTERLLKQVGAPAGLRAVNLIWFLAIAYSTLATKQHVVLDVVGGALLGTAFAVPSLWLWSRVALPLPLGEQISSPRAENEEKTAG